MCLLPLWLCVKLHDLFKSVFLQLPRKISHAGWNCLQSCIFRIAIHSNIQASAKCSIPSRFVLVTCRCSVDWIFRCTISKTILHLWLLLPLFFCPFEYRKSLSDIPSNSRTLDIVVMHFVLRVISMEIGLIFSMLYSVKQYSGIPECCRLFLKGHKVRLSVSMFT